MNTYTDTFTDVTVHFDDAETSFSALQDRDGSVFVTDETRTSLKVQGFNMEDAEATNTGLYDISDFPINFDDEHTNPTIGDRVRALYPNEAREGTVTEIRTDPKVKRLVVRFEDGRMGYFHPHQVEVI